MYKCAHAHSACKQLKLVCRKGSHASVFAFKSVRHSGARTCHIAPHRTKSSENICKRI